MTFTIRDHLAKDIVVMPDTVKEPVEKAKNKRSPSRTISVTATETIRNRLEMSVLEFTEAIGYHGDSYNNWIKSGQIPIVASLAAECLMRRQAASDVVFMVRIVKGVPKVTLIDNPTRVIRNGKTYLEIPDTV